MTKKPAKKAAPKKKAPRVARSMATEDILRKAQKAIEGKDFASLDELNAFLATLSGSKMLDTPEDVEFSPKEEAQELAFDAMEAESEAEARKLAKRALRLDPDCVDALVLLTSLDAETPKQAIAGIQKAVAAGERWLGAKFIKENKGHFWVILETRPYMRALGELANLLRGEGIRLDAIRIYEKMLELNPNDNQGVRDSLLGQYLAVGNLAGAGKLLKKYERDSMANFAWGRVLERFLSGDLTGAAAALKKARKANRIVEEYMTAKRPLPAEPPESYSPGSEEEATLCMQDVGLAWAMHKEAVFWLFDQVETEHSRPVPSKIALLKAPVKGKRLQ